MKIHTVEEGVRGVPAAKYIGRAWPMLPGWVIRDAFKKRSVQLNGKRITSDAPISSGDVLKMYILDEYFAAPLEILYEDNELLAVNKPAGLPCEADQKGIGADTLLARVQAYVPGTLLCHRLDTGTSGVLLCAKTEKAHERLLKAFKLHSLQKEYRLICCGKLHPGQDTLHGWPKKDAGASHVTIYDHALKGAVEIETAYRLLNTIEAGGMTFSHAEVTLITGRTHQIRAHMAFIDHPLLGDDKYGDRTVNKRFNTGVCLHASRLILMGEALPDAWQGLTFTAPEPDWRVF